MREETLVIVKPDAYSRGLLGNILERFERRGLAVEQIRVSISEIERIDAHYPTDEDWLTLVGSKTIEDYKSRGRDLVGELGTDHPLEIGRLVRSWLSDYLASGPLVPMVLSGNRAIESVRATIGSTLPITAAPGTIRGDYSCDSADLASSESRPVHNLVHASGNQDEAAREIRLWFPDR